MTGLSIAALALAVAVLLRPGTALVTARLAALQPPPATPRRTFGSPILLASAGIALTAMIAAGPTGLLLALPIGLAIGAHRLARRLPDHHWLTELTNTWRTRLNTRRRTTARDPLRLASCWDLLAACLRGGLPVPVAVQAIAADMPTQAADALRHTAELLALGSDPVAAWAPALAEPLTAELARGARRSARSGAALAAVAEGLATRVRAGADDLAEARAQRAAVAVTGPLGLCFLPAFLCIGVVPVVIGLATRLMASW